MSHYSTLVVTNLDEVFQFVVCDSDGYLENPLSFNVKARHFKVDPDNGSAIRLQV